MSNSIKSNYIYNLLNTVSGLLFPIITFPYVSRIMLADGVGKINFLNSIIAYITLFSCLGIPLYAVREIAKIRDDKRKLSITASEILILHLGLTLIGYFAVGLIALTVGKVQADFAVFLILSATIILTTIGCDWLFQGVEDFKYIALRGIVIKTLSLGYLLVFVQTKADIIPYAIYTVVGVLGGNVFNFYRLRKYVHLRDFSLSELQPLRHLKPALHIFVLNLIISIYVNLDTIMLGFRKDETAVGLYTAASRLSKMCLGITSSLGVVLLPRFSNLIATGKHDEFARLANKAVSYIVAIALPITVGMIFLSSSIIRLFCGASFAAAVPTLAIISPIIIAIGLSGIIGIQILYPMGKENIVIIATASGAILNFTLNWFLIPHYAQNGAAFATLVAEFSVTIVMLIVGRKYMPINIFSKRNLNYVIATVFMGIALFACQQFQYGDAANLVISVAVGFIVYALYLLMAKDELSDMVLKLLRLKL